jgi:hypothetical protein
MEPAAEPSKEAATGTGKPYALDFRLIGRGKAQSKRLQTILMPNGNHAVIPAAWAVNFHAGLGREAPGEREG